MNIFTLMLLFFSFSLQRGISQRASSPPRGWNSYDSFCWVVSEEEFLQNAYLVSQKLHPYGYEYAVVDYLWYRKNVKGAYPDSLGFDVIDEWGRMAPDPVRWPSSVGGKGFSEVANKVHGLGLKFGIHVMRGISTQAVNANTPILDISTGRAYEESGRKWYAKDIGITERACAWMPHGFMSVNTKFGAGRAFLRSIYQQYADWGVDFVKHDCVFGDDLDLDEITYVSQVLIQFNRPILYSLSPGSSVTAAMAQKVNDLVNMYRITGDDWDSWGDVAAHFDVIRDVASAQLIGAKGLKGKSWPDLDMLPLGWLTDPGSAAGPHRTCNLNLDEQRTQMTLWSMAKSPLMFGGDMRKLDEKTLSLLTNPTLLEINAHSSNNMEFPHITGEKYLSSHRFLAAQSQNFQNKNHSKDRYLALTSCRDTNAKGWFAKAVDDDLEQVCWRGNSGSKHQPPFCLYKKKPIVASDEEMATGEDCTRKIHLLVTKKTQFCLGASPSRKLTSKEFKRGSIFPCRREANQMWKLNYNGTLANSYSDLCASVNNVKGNAVPAGVRSWLATGSRGEIYVAFFNLNPARTMITAKLSDIDKALPGRNVTDGSCTCKELWTGTNFRVLKDSLSMAVESHGSALFTLKCK